MRLIKLPLYTQITIGLVLGILFAIFSSTLGFSAFTISWIDPFGEIFIRALKLIAIPLVLFSIIKGITGLSDTTKLGRLAFKTICIYLLTTVIAITIGLTIVNTIKPGELVSDDQRQANRAKYEMWVAGTDGVELIDGEKSGTDAMLEQRIKDADAAKNRKPLQFLVDIVPDNIFKALSDGGMMLQIIFFAIFFGVTLLFVDQKTVKPVLDFVDGANEVFIGMVNILMKGAPFFVFALMAGVISKLAGDDTSKMIEVFKGLSWYSLTVLIGLGTILFGLYPLIASILSKRVNYRSFFKAMGPAQLLALSTSSSAATLPVTMECVNNNLKVDKNISSFVLPIGATINMDGTALYQAIAVVFLAQFHMVDLTLAQQITIVLTAVLASIGSAAIPSAGLIMMVIILESVGLNPAWIAIIFPVDRILDMCRTVVNVTGDAVVTLVVDSTEKKGIIND